MKGRIKGNMKLFGSILIVGVLIIMVVPLFRGEVPPDQAGGFGAAVLTPIGYFLMLIGAAGAAVSWIRNRKI